MWLLNSRILNAAEKSMSVFVNRTTDSDAISNRSESSKLVGKFDHEWIKLFY